MVHKSAYFDQFHFQLVLHLHLLHLVEYECLNFVENLHPLKFGRVKIRHILFSSLTSLSNSSFIKSSKSCFQPNFVTKSSKHCNKSPNIFTSVFRFDFLNGPTASRFINKRGILACEALITPANGSTLIIK